MLTLALLFVAAVWAGATGTWSPCGLSSVETLRHPYGSGARAARALAPAAFAVGCVAGGVITFGGLGALGALVGAPGAVGVGLAVALAAAAALAEFRRLRVLPQIPRQVPEPWRRTLPFGIALGLYGLLLGLGFTTFILTFAVWALAGVAVALGSVAAGLAIGVGFGVGRAIPVVVLVAVSAERSERAFAAMLGSVRPLSLARTGNGVALALVAGLLALGPGVGAAGGAQVVQAGAFDPGVSGSALAWVRPDGATVVRLGRGRVVVEDADLVAVGEGRLATVRGAEVAVRPLRAPASRATVRARVGWEAQHLAVSGAWVAWVEVDRRGVAAVRAVPLAGRGRVRTVYRAARGAALDRPALAGRRLLVAESGRRGSRVVAVDLRTGDRRVLRGSRTAQFSAPALRAGRVALVRTDYCAQSVIVFALARPGGQRLVARFGSSARRDRGFETGRTSQGSEAARCPAGTPARSDTVVAALALDGRRLLAGLVRPSAAGAARPRGSIVALALPRPGR